MATAKKKPAAPKKKPAVAKKTLAVKKKSAGPRRAAIEALPPAPIPFDIAPHFARVRASIDKLVTSLRQRGVPVKLGAPASVEAILGAERARGISLPNDYRALLTLHDGMILFDRTFFGTRDYIEDTSLTLRAREFLESSVEQGLPGIEDCIPLASWGLPSDWLLYDPRGEVRGGGPGPIVTRRAGATVMKDVCDALAHLEKSATR